MKNRRSIFSIIIFILLFKNLCISYTSINKNVLIVVEGTSKLTNIAMGDGRQLATLLGHFNTSTDIIGADEYKHNQLNNYDFIFYIGFHHKVKVPHIFSNDLLHTKKTIIWLNTGFKEFSEKQEVRQKLGFYVSELDTSSNFDYVKFFDKTFTKGEPNLNRIKIVDLKKVNIIATAYSSSRKIESPYIIKSDNFYYVGDSPFASATESDRYLLFADMLHDILGEQHEHSYSAILRIEDIGPLDDPGKLRDIADFLADRGIPFLFSVYPIYIDPYEGLRISLSDKPDLVDALRYMVRNGGTLVMHGVTHQYKGISASDFEFWDESTNGPIKNESEAIFSKKIELGLHEFTNNGLYPLLWETPHYTGSIVFYKTISKFFSTAIEQRLSIENFDYSQFFPYIILKDLYGQTIYPENLGYVPLDENNPQVSKDAVRSILKNAEINLNVRDGFASFFFHSFLDLDLLEELVEGIQKLGYTFIDLKEKPHWVRFHDKIILSGTQSQSYNLNTQYLIETYFDSQGEVIKRTQSESRFKGEVKLSVDLKNGEFYLAEPSEFRQRQLTFYEKAYYNLEKFINKSFKAEEILDEARPVILWNHYAKGAYYNDQASLVSVFSSVNIHVDTIYVGQTIDLTKYNLLIVPMSFVDSLKPTDYNIITAFVENGGNVITDGKNYLAEEFGIKFLDTRIRVHKIQDKFFPEENISWRYDELITKFETYDIDEIFCIDEYTSAPLVIGKRIQKGKLIFISSLFDPYTQNGYSLYPFLMEYVRQYFNLMPFIRMHNVEVFFDPGYRHNYSIENLIKQWLNYGIRIIHVAAWHQYPKYTYDYNRLINLAHANGILVYAWIGPPQVSHQFWNDNPQWREKNYLGQDARPSWRYPVALTDSKCTEAMYNEYKKIINSYDWDGINLAELYFEAGNGFEEPNHFTPMHHSAILEVKSRYGIELDKIFDPSSKFYWKTHPNVQKIITDYRVEKLNKIYEDLLNIFSDIAKNKPGFQIIVTAMDGYSNPKLREYIGVDMDKIIALQKKYNFYLNIQDPQSMWSKEPTRYIGIGQKYQEVLGNDQYLMLDLNIMNFRKEDEITPFPTLIPTGTESFLLVKSASSVASRVVIYSEASVNPQDMRYLSYALASRVKYNRKEDSFIFNSPYSFYIKLKKGVDAITLNGTSVSNIRDNIFLIPAGNNIVKTNVTKVNAYSTHELQTHLISITGNLLSISYGLRDIKFVYESDNRVFVSLNKKPTSIKVDDKDYDFKVMKGNDRFTVLLPPGRHTVELVGGSAFTYGLNLTSLWSSVTILIFGILAITLIFLMWLYLKYIKRRYALNN